MKKLYLALAVALLLPQIVFGFTLPKGAEILTSPSQIKDFKILGQSGKTGSFGSFLYGIRKDVTLGYIYNPIQPDITTGSDATLGTVTTTKINFGTANSTVVKNAPTAIPAGSNILNDGGLELWTNTTTLTAWAYLYTGAGTPSTTKELTVVHSGTSSLKIVGDADGTTAGITESIGSLTVGASYQATAWMKNGGSGNGGLVILNDFSGTATQMWSFASSSWVAFTGLGGIGADNTHQFTLSGTYALQTSPVFTVPASGRLAPVFLGDTAVASKTIYIDDVSLFTASGTSPSATTTLFSFTNPSNLTNMTNDTPVFDFKITGGTGRIYYSFLPNGTVKVNNSSTCWITNLFSLTTSTVSC